MSATPRYGSTHEDQAELARIAALPEGIERTRAQIIYVGDDFCRACGGDYFNYGDADCSDPYHHVTSYIH